MIRGQCHTPQSAPPASLPKTGPSLLLRKGYITPLQPASSPRLGRICVMGMNVRDIMINTGSRVAGVMPSCCIAETVSAGSCDARPSRPGPNALRLKRKNIAAPIQLKIWGPIRAVMKYLNLNFGFQPRLLKGSLAARTPMRGSRIAMTLNRKKNKIILPFL